MSEPVTPGRARPDAPRLLVLSALFPGLGHLAAGRRAWGLALALPFLGLLVAIGIVALTTNSTSLAARMFDPAVLGAVLGIEAIVLGWRLFAVGALRVVTPFRARPATLAAGALALLIILGPQVYLAAVTVDARDAAAEVYEPVAEGGAWVPDASAPPVASNDPDFGVEASPSPDPSDSASPSSVASATPGVPRINVLLIGMDSGVGRTTALTDTMIVASLDPVGKTVSMASIPRDMVDVPLPDGRSFRGKINSLVSYVNNHPSKFPGAKDGESVLTAALGDLLGLKIDRWAQVNLGGFVHLVDSVGGVTINVTDGFCDPGYQEYGVKGFGVSPGRYHMNGDQALAYARIRHAVGESDFTRAARQQEVIAALRDRLVKGAFATNPGGFLRSLGQTIRTNIKPGFIADYIDIAGSIPRKDVYRVVIGHPYVKGALEAVRGSIQKPNLKLIRGLAARLFTPTGVRPKGFDTMPSAGSGATRNASSSSTCGVRATPRPTAKPKPTPRPTAKPTAAPATPKPTPSAEPSVEASTEASSAP